MGGRGRESRGNGGGLGRKRGDCWNGGWGWGGETGLFRESPDSEMRGLGREKLRKDASVGRLENLN